MSSEIASTEERAKLSPSKFSIEEYWPLIYLTIGLGLLVFLLYDALAYMVYIWGEDEYSYGYMVPMTTIYLIMKKFPDFEDMVPKAQWLGVVVLLVGLGVFLVGELSSLYSIIHYAFIICIFGLFITLIGTNGIKKISAALVYLIFMVPIPHFIFFNLSQELQLISSSLGVAILRLMDVSVFLEGNVIDLGVFDLQVVEACSGLNYLFPLMSFSFLVAYIYESKAWEKVIIFLSAIPITIFMNSFRIAIIGITVDNWGIAAAQGFLHDFEGWVIFMACLGLLFLEIWLIHLITRQKGSVIDRLDVHLPIEVYKQSYFTKLLPHKRLPIVGIILILLSVPFGLSLSERQESIPDRSNLNALPLINNGWWGREGALETDVIGVLKFTDYFIADFKHNDFAKPVNFYIAYYESQRKGASIHSPRTCLPGGGWKMRSLEVTQIEGVQGSDGKPLKVNRSVIQKGEHRTLVYYWFQQRGRVITNEFLAKWFIFWDALTMGRTDGALVRVTASLSEQESIESADTRLKAFLGNYVPMLPEYIPN